LGVFFASVALILFCVAYDLETAKLAGVNPKTYLLEATRIPAPPSCRTLRRTELPAAVRVYAQHSAL